MKSDSPGRRPQTVPVAAETIVQVRALADPRLHDGDRRDAAERLCRVLDDLLDQARQGGEAR